MIKRILLTSTIALLLSACGGGGGGSDDNNSDDSKTNKAPIVDVGTSRTIYLNISSTIRGSATDDGTIVSYEWKKGTKVLANTAAFSYTATKLGTETLVLTVVDNDGLEASGSLSLKVINRAIVDPSELLP